MSVWKWFSDNGQDRLCCASMEYPGFQRLLLLLLDFPHLEWAWYPVFCPRHVVVLIIPATLQSTPRYLRMTPYFPSFLSLPCMFCRLWLFLRLFRNAGHDLNSYFSWGMSYRAWQGELSGKWAQGNIGHAQAVVGCRNADIINQFSSRLSTRPSLKAIISSCVVKGFRVCVSWRKRFPKIAALACEVGNMKMWAWTLKYAALWESLMNIDIAWIGQHLADGNICKRHLVRFHWQALKSHNLLFLRI